MEKELPYNFRTKSWNLSERKEHLWVAVPSLGYKSVKHIVVIAVVYYGLVLTIKFHKFVPLLSSSVTVLWAYINLKLSVFLLTKQ